MKKNIKEDFQRVGIVLAIMKMDGLLNTRPIVEMSPSSIGGDPKLANTSLENVVRVLKGRFKTTPFGKDDLIDIGKVVHPKLADNLVQYLVGQNIVVTEYGGNRVSFVAEEKLD